MRGQSYQESFSCVESPDQDRAWLDRRLRQSVYCVQAVRKTSDACQVDVCSSKMKAVKNLANGVVRDFDFRFDSKLA